MSSSLSPSHLLFSFLVKLTSLSLYPPFSVVDSRVLAPRTLATVGNSRFTEPNSNTLVVQCRPVRLLPLFSLFRSPSHGTASRKDEAELDFPLFYTSTPLSSSSPSLLPRHPRIFPSSSRSTTSQPQLLSGNSLLRRITIGSIRQV